MGRQRYKIQPKKKKKPKTQPKGKKIQNIGTTRSHKCPTMPVKGRDSQTEWGSSALAYLPILW